MENENDLTIEQKQEIWKTKKGYGLSEKADEFIKEIEKEFS